MARNTMIRALAVALALVTTGCGVTGSFAQTAGSYPHSNRSPSEIELFLEGEKPPRPYKAVGIVSTVADTFALTRSMNVAPYLEKLREAAAKAGLDGVFDIRVAAPGTVGARSCQGTGFVYE